MPGTYSITQRAAGSLLTAAIYNEDHSAHLTFNTPGGVDDYSANVAQMQSTVDPGESGTESLPTDLAGEIQRLRHVIKEMTGKTYWYESPTALMYTNLVAELSLTSGATKDFTGIPAGVKRVTLMIASASTNGTSNYLVQIGDAGGLEVTGYQGSIAAVFNVNTTTCEAIAAGGFTIINSVAAAGSYMGKIVLDLAAASTNTWIASSMCCRETTAHGVFTMTGFKQLSSTLDRIRLTTVNGTDTFDVGIVSIKYE